ncbi:MAG: hypothetical protein GC164_02705 [Phycisphaera sp.]|nr:hypothetical protein [Phycisphaera sp.]
MAIDDLVTQRGRTSDETWESEMMCLRPRRDQCVYPAFRVEKHVVEEVSAFDFNGVPTVAGMDFGVRSPLVMLRAKLIDEGQPLEQRRIIVTDEYVQSDLTLDANLDRIAAQHSALPRWLAVDPAGAQRNSHTGVSDIDVLRKRGYVVRYRASSLHEGIDRVRRRLDHGSLLILSKCPRLIEGLSSYHFDPDRPWRDAPIKDGPDHVCDALRYLVVNLESATQPVKRMDYM